MQHLGKAPQSRSPSQRGRAVAGRPAHVRRNWTLGAIGLLVGMVLLIGVLQGQPAPRSEAAGDEAPQVGHAAPAFSLATSSGGNVQLADLRGQVVLVNFWATWCPPCRAEMPAIQAAYERYNSQGFSVLAVTADEDRAAVQAFVHDRGLSFPALLDTTGQVHAAYLANGLPSSYFIDRQGIVRAIHRGPMTEAMIEAQLASLIAEQ